MAAGPAPDGTGRVALITGGTGYLGQFVVLRFADLGYKVVYTYSGTREAGVLAPLGASPRVTGVRVDLAQEAGVGEASGEELRRALGAVGLGPRGSHGGAASPPDVVVNCAALAEPWRCDRDRGLADKLNVPRALLGWLAGVDRARAAGEAPSTLVHVSTDQVYDGSRAWWSEHDERGPRNAYALSKARGEVAVAEASAAAGRPFALLRCSIMVGPEPPVPVARTLPIQALEQALAEAARAEALAGASETGARQGPRSGSASPVAPAPPPGPRFFTDEFRCHVWVGDVVRAIETLAADPSKIPTDGLVNVGGPERLSRADAAREVAARRWGRALPEAWLVPRESVLGPDGAAKSPAEISMRIDRLRSLGVDPKPFAEVVRDVLL